MPSSRPSSSSAAATWTSLCVSTPPITRTASSGGCVIVVIAIPSCRLWMARTAGPGQANDEAPRTSFFQVTFDQLVVPVALRSPSRRIGHEDISTESGGIRVRPGERSATTHSHFVLGADQLQRRHPCPSERDRQLRQWWWQVELSTRRDTDRRRVYRGRTRRRRTLGHVHGDRRRRTRSDDDGRSGRGRQHAQRLLHRRMYRALGVRRCRQRGESARLADARTGTSSSDLTSATRSTGRSHPTTSQWLGDQARCSRSGRSLQHRHIARADTSAGE